MIKSNDKCVGCGACVEKCPKKCIRLEKKTDGFYYPVVDEKKCVGCNLCDKVCPIDTKAKINDVIIYGGSISSEFIKEASGGGIYPLILKNFFEMYPSGIAYGVRFINNKVEHYEIENMQNIKEALGSKYVISDMSKVFESIMNNLNNKKNVLFSGTPCQVAAVKKFVNNSKLLITQSVICHGVASPKVLEKYIQYHSSQYNSNVINLKFRSKNKSWEEYGMEIEFQNHTKVFYQSNVDLFHRAYGSNISLRKSCYNCQFKFPNYFADIILGDFWNANKIKPLVYNKEGTSILFVNGQIGQNLVKTIINDGKFEKLNFKEALQSQKGIIKNVKQPKNRDKFFSEIGKNDFKLCVDKYAKLPLMIRLKIRIKKILRK